MLMNNRIIVDDNGTLTDVSASLSDIHADTVTLPVAAATSAIYIGSDLPFNHRFIDVNTANSNASALSVELWDGSAFVAAVDEQDQTSSGGNTLAASDILSWTPKRENSWVREDTTEDIPDLSTLTIYDMYWAKLTWSADLSAGTILNYVGHRFSDDEDLRALYPSLLRSDVLDKFQSGKTDWDIQHVEAAENIIRKLRGKNIIISKNQLLNWEQFSEASKHEVASMAFREFGEDYVEDFNRAKKDFHQALNLKQFEIDRDRDARLDPSERRTTVEYVRR